MGIRTEKLKRWRDPATLLLLLAAGFGVTLAYSRMTAPPPPTVSTLEANSSAISKQLPPEHGVVEATGPHDGRPATLEPQPEEYPSLQDLVAGEDPGMRTEALALLSLVEQEGGQ
jgi:hypothetical protein